MTTVWVSTLRRGISYHQCDSVGQKTLCGRFIGAVDGEALHGHLIDLERAMTDYGATACRRCSGEASVVKPRIRGRYR